MINVVNIVLVMTLNHFL